MNKNLKDVKNSPTIDKTNSPPDKLKKYRIQVIISALLFLIGYLSSEFTKVFWIFSFSRNTSAIVGSLSIPLIMVVFLPLILAIVIYPLLNNEKKYSGDRLALNRVLGRFMKLYVIAAFIIFLLLAIGTIENISASFSLILIPLSSLSILNVSKKINLLPETEILIEEFYNNLFKKIKATIKFLFKILLIFTILYFLFKYYLIS